MPLRSRTHRRLVASSAALLALGAASEASAFSTRVHMMIANQIREALIQGGGDQIPLKLGTHAVKLQPQDVKALVDHPLAFRAGAVGPDNMVFPGMTDPSHALGTRPYEQCELLYKEAFTDEERAYAIGCFLHGTTDAIAHHYVNYMSGETFTLTPITSGRQQSWTNVVRHIVAEDMIQKKAFELKPEAFSSGQLSHAIPKSFVLRAYLDDTSPVWALMAHHPKEKFEAAEAKNPGASLPTLLASSGLAPAEQMVMSPVYVKRLQASRELLRDDLKNRIKVLQDPSSVDGSELGVSAGPDGKLGTYDDDTACAASCPVLYATYFTYVGLLLPRKSASGTELPPAFDKISDKLGEDIGQFLPAYMDTVENLSAMLNTPLKAGGPGGLGIEKSDISTAFQPMNAWADNITTIDYETLVQAVAPDWLIGLQDAMQAVGINVAISGIVKAIFQPVVQPIKDGIKEYVINQAEQQIGTLIDEYKATEAAIRAEYTTRLDKAAGAGLGGNALDHFFDSGLYNHSFNIAAATFASHQIILPVGNDPIGVGPASFDASHTPSWMQAGLCDYLQKEVFPLGFDVKGTLSVKSGSTLFAASVADDSPVECHDGALTSFASSPSQAVCGIVELQSLIDDPAHEGSLSRAFPPAFAAQKPACLFLPVPGLPDPPQPPVGGSGGSGGSGQGNNGGTGQGNSGGTGQGNSGGVAGSGQGNSGGAPGPGAGGAPIALCNAGEACTVGKSPDPCYHNQGNDCFLTCKCFNGVYACDQQCQPMGNAGGSGPGSAGKGGTSAAPSGNGAAPADSGSEGGCGCAVPGAPASPASPAAPLAALGLAAFLRRRRRGAVAALAALSALLAVGCGDDGSDTQSAPVVSSAGGNGGSNGGAGGSTAGTAGAAGSGAVCGQGRPCTPGQSIDPCFKDLKNGCFLVCKCQGNTYACDQQCEGMGGQAGSGQAGSGQAGQAAAGQAGAGQAGTGQGGAGQAGTGQAGAGQAGQAGQASGGQGGGEPGGAGGQAGGAAGSGGAPAGGDCCTPHETAGCMDAAIQQCVCAKDAFCCDTKWDETCVSEIVDFACGSCGGAGGAGGAGGSPQLAFLNALGDSTWHGLQPRQKGNKSVTRAVQLEFSASSLQWVEIVNPFGPSRKREHRAFTVDADGKTVKTTVDAPAGWPVPPNNGQKRTFSVQISGGSPRTMTVTLDGVDEFYEEGPYPAPTGGLTATVRSFQTGPISDAFCTSGLNGFDYKLIWDFARGKTNDSLLATDVVAGAKLEGWVDNSGNNQFSVVDIDGFDALGGTDLSDQYNFFVTYTGMVKHPGGSIQMRELNDSVEDGIWAFLGNGVGSTNSNDVFLEVQGFAWPDLTADAPSASFSAGDVPVEVILVRCAKAISPVDVMISLNGGSLVHVGSAPTKPEINSKLFPPGLF